MNDFAMKDLRRSADDDCDYRQVRITARLCREQVRVEQASSRAQGLLCDSAVTVACDFNLDIGAVPGANWNGLW